ncbi:MAG TPA: hypothetical protein VGL35_11450 [Rhizomicrobium sp.]|jgi:hypothetical protein
MNKVVEVLRRERAELAELGNRPEEWLSTAFTEISADCRRRIGEIEELLSEFEQA